MSRKFITSIPTAVPIPVGRPNSKNFDVEPSRAAARKTPIAVAMPLKDLRNSDAMMIHAYLLLSTVPNPRIGFFFSDVYSTRSLTTFMPKSIAITPTTPHSAAEIINCVP